MLLRKILSFILALVMATLSLCACGDEPAENDEPTPCEYYLERADELAQREVVYVNLEIEDYGNIRLALDATAAPITVRHFLKLVQSGFYDGLSLHGATMYYVMGGDPNFDGSGYYTDPDGNLLTVEGEFLVNGYGGNDISHRRGVISYINYEGDSASSQFFICNTDITDFDGYYAAFGYVADGMDVIDAVTDEIADLGDYYGVAPKAYQPKIKKATVEQLGNVDPNEKITIDHGGSDECAYVQTRDITGRDVVYVEMVVKHYGTIVLLLDRTTAPITVDNFLKLVNEGFYDGLTFHRVIEDFMIQGGDPDANGTGGYKDEDGNKITIEGEFSDNGHENDIKHIRGVISMARGTGNNTASSQFFICNASPTHLDGKYAAFGYVVSGLKVVDAITRATAGYAYNGVIYEKPCQAIIESVRVIPAPAQ